MKRRRCGPTTHSIKDKEAGMADPKVHLLVELTIHEGKLDVFKGIAQEMIAGSQVEPGTLGYEWYLSSDGTRCRIVESYATRDDVLAHFTGPVVQQLVPKLVQHSRLDRFEVYGDPGLKAAAMLAEFGAEIFERWQGLNR
jgi:quinol monooxygenase YgiN